MELATLPADNHTHSEWSWDAPRGSMAGSCARAVELGLPSIAFTEHLDFTVWTLSAADAAAHDHLAGLVTPEGTLTPPAFDVAGYLAAIEECRQRFPGLRILSGVEVGEAHWHADAVARTLKGGHFDRVIGSLHCLRTERGFSEPWALMPHRDPTEVVREYLAGIVELVQGSDVFEVLTHVDYPLRSWPASAGPLDVTVFEEEYRHALRATARAGRALEINTRRPLDATILRWWHEEGGGAVSFGSDAHVPEQVARGFREAAEMAAAFGFRPGSRPYDLWGRS
ncbi:PHP domain-containing protein [Symbioplanes lichenis]|uniref:PHP domain-containing protein n=1 Tax=Symbioplanes lichenis TaxID=1629072 RepID=UPI0027390EDE|nr:PHP domain-containing protein [Actinoplanes lichenis]